MTPSIDALVHELQFARKHRNRRGRRRRNKQYWNRMPRAGNYPHDEASIPQRLVLDLHDGAIKELSGCAREPPRRTFANFSFASYGDNAVPGGDFVFISLGARSKRARQLLPSQSRTVNFSSRTARIMTFGLSLTMSAFPLMRRRHCASPLGSRRVKWATTGTPVRWHSAARQAS